MRVGTGYDIHPLVAGRDLVLGGIHIPFPRGEAAHSDGDVLIHAIIDALLGATADGDIGMHFPPSDESFRGACSRGLLRTVAQGLHRAGRLVLNVDATVIIEAPRLAPYLPNARTNIAEDLGIQTSSVSVKAKSNEGLDSVGRGEAVACHAVVLVDDA